MYCRICKLSQMNWQPWLDVNSHISATSLAKCRNDGRRALVAPSRITAGAVSAAMPWSFEGRADELEGYT